MKVSKKSTYNILNEEKYFGAITLVQQMFHGTHYIGDEILAHFQEGEEWRKTFGPFFVYLNSTNNVSNAYNLWEDDKKQVQNFTFVSHEFSIKNYEAIVTSQSSLAYGVYFHY